MHSRCASWRQITAPTFLHTYWLKITASAFWARWFGGWKSGGRERRQCVGHWISSFQTLLWQLIPGCSSVWWQHDFLVFPKVFYGLFIMVLWVTFLLQLLSREKYQILACFLCTFLYSLLMPIPYLSFQLPPSSFLSFPAAPFNLFTYYLKQNKTWQ